MDEDPRRAPQVFVQDPDNFNRQQRFKEIHDARQSVTEYISNLEERIDPERHSPGTAPFAAQEQLAFRVSMYITELLPLLEDKGGDDPYLSKRFPENSRVDDLEHYAINSGMLKPHTDRQGTERTTAVRITESLRVFQIANQAYAELGMDLDIGEKQGDAGFDYSDILEEGPPGDGDKPDITADGTGGNE